MEKEKEKKRHIPVGKIIFKTEVEKANKILKKRKEERRKKTKEDSVSPDS